MHGCEMVSGFAEVQLRQTLREAGNRQSMRWSSGYHLANERGQDRDQHDDDRTIRKRKECFPIASFKAFRAAQSQR